MRGSPSWPRARFLPAWAGGFALACVYTWAASRWSYFPGDTDATRAVQWVGDAVPIFGQLFHRMNAIGGGYLALVSIAVIVGELAYARRFDLVSLLLVMNVLRPASTIIKWLVDRPRPSAVLVTVTEHAGDSSFPSGHALGAVLLYGGLAVILEATSLPRPVRRSLQACCLLVVLLIGLARMYTGAHWLSDVLGGYLWGALLIAAVWHVASTLTSWRGMPRTPRTDASFFSSHGPWFPLGTGLLIGELLVVALAAAGGEYGQEAGKGAVGQAEAGEHGSLGTLFTWLNVGLISGSLASGPLLLFRRTRQLLARRSHRLFGWSLVALFVVDLLIIRSTGGEQGVVERLNLLLIAGLAATSVILFAKPPALWRTWYWPVRNIHVILAMTYAVKFFAEPLFGGKLG